MLWQKWFSMQRTSRATKRSPLSARFEFPCQRVFELCIIEAAFIMDISQVFGFVPLLKYAILEHYAASEILHSMIAAINHAHLGVFNTSGYICRLESLKFIIFYVIIIIIVIIITIIIIIIIILRGGGGGGQVSVCVCRKK